jgi:poly(3-hydroxybutyrate) depolymerase
VIIATGHVVDYYLNKVNTKILELIGYSGGGAVAALLAAERSDVISLRTVAGNLDHDAVNRYQGVDRMPESLNPIDIAEKLKLLPQMHFIGKKDKIVPAAIAEDFANRTGGICSGITYINGVTHEKGWAEHWPSLLKVPLPCSPSTQTTLH